MQETNKPLSPMEIAIRALNKNAELFERKLLSEKVFIENAKTQLRHFLYTGLIDRIEARILLDQILDITNGEYKSFQDPENFMPPVKAAQTNLE